MPNCTICQMHILHMFHLKRRPRQLFRIQCYLLKVVRDRGSTLWWLYLTVCSFCWWEKWKWYWVIMVSKIDTLKWCTNSTWSEYLTAIWVSKGIPGLNTRGWRPTKLKTQDDITHCHHNPYRDCHHSNLRSSVLFMILVSHQPFCVLL